MADKNATNERDADQLTSQRHWEKNEHAALIEALRVHAGSLAQTSQNRAAQIMRQAATALELSCACVSPQEETAPKPTIHVTIDRRVYLESQYGERWCEVLGGVGVDRIRRAEAMSPAIQAFQHRWSLGQGGTRNDHQ